MLKSSHCGRLYVVKSRVYLGSTGLLTFPSQTSKIQSNAKLISRRFSVVALMSHQQLQARGSPSNSAPRGRLRAACNFCHQAKVKCSGKDPCASCQAAHLRCIYSPAGRQGRPKGSKNKRTLMQEREAKAMTHLDAAPHEHHESNGSINSHHQQQQQQHSRSMSTSNLHVNLDMAHDLGPLSPTNQYLGNLDADLLLNTHLDSSLLDATSDSYLENSLNHALDDFSVFSTHVSTFLGTRCPVLTTRR